MQADLAQSQQQKHISLATDGLPASGKVYTDGRDSHKHDDVLAVGQVNNVSDSSQSVTMSENTAAAAAAASLSSQPSRSHAAFTPFAKNPAKQKRYEAYLESVKAGTSCKSDIFSAAFVKETVVFN